MSHECNTNDIWVRHCSLSIPLKDPFYYFNTFYFLLHFPFFTHFIAFTFLRTLLYYAIT